MKGKIVLSLIIVIIAAGIFALYVNYRFNTYARRSFVTLTGISKFQVRASTHNNQECYIETSISKEDKQKILNKYQFEPFPIDWKGNVRTTLIPYDNNDFVYYLQDKGHGLYAYVLYIISKKDNILIVYQQFGD